ncbi:MAG: hypothetical protein SFU25_06840 [Candidatus Caenarcaniphilales bacterium]|nr:hypothetical protein [Candidatus Caenarcaniphilales bacterium]
MKDKVSQNIQDLNFLAEKLARNKSLIKFNNPNESEPESWSLAYALLELENSCSKFTKELLPKLVSENLSEDEINDLLHEIGEELRHILYHIKDSKFYSYLDS